MPAWIRINTTRRCVLFFLSCLCVFPHPLSLCMVFTSDRHKHKHNRKHKNVDAITYAYVARENQTLRFQTTKRKMNHNNNFDLFYSKLQTLSCFQNCFIVHSILVFRPMSKKLLVCHRTILTTSHDKLTTGACPFLFTILVLKTSVITLKPSYHII